MGTKSKFGSCFKYYFLSAFLLYFVVSANAQGFILQREHITSISSKQIPVKIGEKDTVLFVNQVSISLGNNDTVFVENYGYLSGTKTINFLSNDSNIIVKYHFGGSDSVLIPLKNISTAQSGEALMDFPKDSDMPPNDHSDIVIKDVKKFDEKVQGLIDIYFPIGMQQGKIADSILLKKTCYKDLVTNESNLFAQICIFISQPYVFNNMLYCHISYKAREHRSLSPVWRDPGKKVHDIAEKFLSNFINQLKHEI